MLVLKFYNRTLFLSLSLLIRACTHISIQRLLSKYTRLYNFRKKIILESHEIDEISKKVFLNLTNSNLKKKENIYKTIMAHFDDAYFSFNNNFASDFLCVCLLILQENFLF